MSVISCLVLVLMCSFHACNARSLGVLNKGPTQEFHPKRQDYNMKENVEKLNDAGDLIQRDKTSWLPKVSEWVEKEDRSKEVIRVGSETKDHGNKDSTKAKGDQKLVSDAAKNKSLAGVSWRVPNKKRDDPEPGFNLDYLPPKTHPPSHN